MIGWKYWWDHSGLPTHFWSPSTPNKENLQSSPVQVFYVNTPLRAIYLPDLVQAPSKLTIFKCGPKWVIIFSSDMRACFSLDLAVAVEINPISPTELLTSQKKPAMSLTNDYHVIYKEKQTVSLSRWIWKSLTWKQNVLATKESSWFSNVEAWKRI